MRGPVYVSSHVRNIEIGLLVELLKSGAAAVGALRGDRLKLRERKLSARQATEKREKSELTYGVSLPVSAYERELYEAEGLTPPSE